MSRDIVPKIAVMGFGNPCRSDDAIGIYVIDRLREKLIGYPDINILDMGTSAFEVLFSLKGHQRIIIIDAVVNSDNAAGTIFKVPATEIQASIIEDPLVFLHSLKWDQALSYAKKIMADTFPADINVFLIAVENTSLDIRLSEEVRLAGDKVVHHIYGELTEVGSVSEIM